MSLPRGAVALGWSLIVAFPGHSHYVFSNPIIIIIDKVSSDKPQLLSTHMFV